MQDTSDPVYLAFENHKHMQLNKLYVHKKEPAKVFEFEKMSAESGAFKHTPFFGTPQVLQVPHEDLKEWKAWGGKEMPKLIDKAVSDKLLPSMSDALKLEQFRLTAQSAIYSHYFECLAMQWFQIFVVFCL